MNYHFPRVKFAGLNELGEQLKHVCSEANEAEIAYQHADINHLALELCDVIHSAETAMRILEENYGVDVEKAKDSVRKKNEARGYYKGAG